MKTELLTQTELKQEETKLSYLWLNGKRVIGIEGLEIFQNCRLMNHVPVIDKEHRDALNSIIDATLEKYCEEGICNYWPGLVEKTKAYFSKQGYIVKGDKISLDLRQKVELILDPVAEAAMQPRQNIFTSADLWNIQRNRRARILRRFI